MITIDEASELVDGLSNLPWRILSVRVELPTDFDSTVSFPSQLKLAPADLGVLNVIFRGPRVDGVLGTVTLHWNQGLTMERLAEWTPGTFLEFVLGMILGAMDHEMRETILLNGVRAFDPHASGQYQRACDAEAKARREEGLMRWNDSQAPLDRANAGAESGKVTQ